jgi:hypothetical protein
MKVEKRKADMRNEMMIKNKNNSHNISTRKKPTESLLTFNSMQQANLTHQKAKENRKVRSEELKKKCFDSIEKAADLISLKLNRKVVIKSVNLGLNIPKTTRD